MGKLLLLALLLYDVVHGSRPNNYEYDDMGVDAKRHSSMDDKRLWRRKAAAMKTEMEHKDWDERRRHEYEVPRYFDDLDAKGFTDERHREPELSYRRRYDDVDKLGAALANTKSNEIGHPQYIDKEPEKKKALIMNCDRPHERYEACFAGCASISCDNPRDRLRPCYPFCEPGCVCVPPYVRDDRTHKCVLPDECSKGLKGIPDLGDET